MTRTALRNTTIMLAVIAVALGVTIAIILIGRDDEPSVGSGGVTGTAATAEDTFTLEGTITLSTDGADLQLNDDGSWYCIGANGYDDIAEGTRVTVYDPSGAVLATGALGQGGDSVEPCVLPIAVPDVPGGHDTYQVEVSDRGKIVVSATEAKAGQVALTLD